jgi:hypothetical protein
LTLHPLYRTPLAPLHHISHDLGAIAQGLRYPATVSSPKIQRHRTPIVADSSDSQFIFEPDDLEFPVETRLLAVSSTCVGTQLSRTRAESPFVMEQLNLSYSHGEIRCRTPFGNCHQKESFSPLLSSVGDFCMHKVLYYTSNDIGMLHRKIQCGQSCITSYLVKLNSSSLHCAYTSN